MATKQFYATGSFKYNHRMLRAGDPVELDAPSARLFTALGKISADKPKGAKAVVPAMSTETVAPPKPDAKKAKTTKKRATAKK
jgi:hypothetical protein